MKPVFVRVTDIVGYDDGFYVNLNVNHIVWYEQYMRYSVGDTRYCVSIHLTNGDEIQTRMSLNDFENCVDNAIKYAKG